MQFFTASQNPNIVSMRPSEATRSHAMFATEQRWGGVVTTDEKRRIITSRERAVDRDIFTEKHRPQEKPSEVLKGQDKSRSREQGVSGQSFFQCNQLRMREQRAVQKKKRLRLSKNAYLTKRVLDIGRTQISVFSVPRRSLKFHMTELLSCERGSRWRLQKMSVACKSINNESLSTSLLGKKKRPTCSIASSAHPTEPAFTRSWTKPT